MVHPLLCRSLVEDCKKKRSSHWQQESVKSSRKEAGMLLQGQGSISKSHYCINQERVTTEMASLHSIISLSDMYEIFFCQFE